MAEPWRLLGFLVAATGLALVWGRALWYLDERSPAIRRLVFFLLGYLRVTAGRVRALVLTGAYLALGLALAGGLALAFGLEGRWLVSFAPGHLGLCLLGIVGEISLANLLVSLGAGLVGGRARYEEVGEIPWMQGMAELPSAVVPWVAGLAGAVEELVFRGVILQLLRHGLGLSPFLAVTLAGALFCLEQLLQVRTRFQALVVGAGSVAISLVGGLLVVVAESVLPAMLGHAAFVVFFLSHGERERSAWDGAGPREAVR